MTIPAGRHSGDRIRVRLPPGDYGERINRRWYRTGYHKPQDDLARPIDWQAAADFNRFFCSRRSGRRPAGPAGVAAR